MTAGGQQPVTTQTIFQAASISKPLAAIAALQLVEKHKLALDEDVATKLSHWKLPENEFTKTERPTLRRILLHSAGFTVSGFRGYASGETLPSLYDNYVGEYQLAPGAVITISKEGDKLMSQGPGQPRAELLPESETTFFLREVDASFTFIKDQSGRFVQVNVRRGGREFQALRVNKNRIVKGSESFV